MGFRLWRRMKVAPGVHLNLSKSGLSTSFGPRGAKFTVGSKGTRQTVGIPGTGLFYTQTQGSNSKKQAQPQQQPTHARSLDLGFFESLTTPSEEKSFIEGCKCLIDSESEGAYQYFSKSAELADSAFMAGIIAFKLERNNEAVQYLSMALEKQGQLGTLLNKYGIQAGVNLPITDEIVAFIESDYRGVLLALTEVYQAQGNLESAKQCLFALRKIEPEDVLIKLSLVEIYFDRATDKNQLKAILNITQGIENESPIHAAVLLYRARALRMLGLNDASREILTATLRKKKDRSPDLMLALRYEHN